MRTPASRSANRVRMIRLGAGMGTMGPATCVPYLLATLDGRNRPELLVTAGVMIAVMGLTWWRAEQIARSRVRMPVQLVGMLTTVLGTILLTALDGGITGPLGAFVPMTLVFFAIMLPPRVFAVIGLVSACGYAWIAGAGPPAPRGYAFTYAAGFAAVSFLCHRHAGALASLRRRLAEVVRVDPLTGCLNRRGFDESLDRELAQAEHTGEPVTLVLIDLDLFKHVNDAHGHRGGDELLAWTARVLRQELGRQDAVGRLGGDEFALLLTGGDDGAVRATLDRVRKAVGLSAPASFGHATYPADAGTAAGLMQLADRRLYADKGSRERAAPSRAAVEAARHEVFTGGGVTVSRRERRRRSIADMGWIAGIANLIGVVYVAVLAPGHPHRAAITLLVVVGGASGFLLVTVAGRLSRARAARRWMTVVAVAFFLDGGASAVLDGGVTGPIAVGVLLPMPLIALGTPPGVAASVVGGAAAGYALIGTAVGGASGWYVTMHLVGIITLSIACAVQGRSDARQRRLLTRLSQVDVLTDCLNRRGFEERFTAELARARRSGQPLALLLLDLDGFKQVNDTRGHAAGDDLLIQVAQALCARLDPEHVLGRLAGDEFVVVLTGPGARDAGGMAEQLRDALAGRTAVSVGVAALDRHGADFDELYGHAYDRVQEQKRNRHGGVPRQRSAPVGGGIPATLGSLSPAAIRAHMSGDGLGGTDPDDRP